MSVSSAQVCTTATSKIIQITTSSRAARATRVRTFTTAFARRSYHRLAGREVSGVRAYRGAGRRQFVNVVLQSTFPVVVS